MVEAMVPEARHAELPGGVMTELVIRALGSPAPQGSKSYKGTRNGHAILVESSKHVKPWRRDVETAAVSAIRAWEASAPERAGMWMPLDGPLELRIEFYLRRPNKPMDPDFPITYPDNSKLIRSTEDALVRAGVVRDDARFVRHVVDKLYAEPGQPTGARIIIRPRMRAAGEQLAVI